MDPITIGALAAAALSAGAGEAGKAVLGQAARDAYDSLKALVARWAAPDVTALETRAQEGGDTRNRQAVLAEAIDARPEPDREEARTLAEALSAALTAEGRGAALATVVNNFHAGRDQYVAQSGGTINIDRRGG
jgi:hypothetical protein